MFMHKGLEIQLLLGVCKMSNKLDGLFEKVMPALESKKNEFHYFDYPTVMETDIWKFLIDKKWRKKNVEEMHIYELVNDILETTPAEYMTHTQIQSFKATENWFSEINKNELDVLLNSKATINEING